jgi:hypothetical protein
MHAQEPVAVEYAQPAGPGVPEQSLSFTHWSRGVWQ